MSRRVAVVAMHLLALGCSDANDPAPSPSATSTAIAPTLPPPQGHIVQIIEDYALDDEQRVWRDRDGVYVREDFTSRPRRLLGWPARMLADGTVRCEAHFYPGYNPRSRPSWAASEWDRDGISPRAFKVFHDLREWGAGEYVEARGADEVFFGCFRRGARVYRSGRDVGCPRANPLIVNTSIEPDLPDELPGAPDVVGTCWSPVEQPLEAARLFPGCLALDTMGALHQLHVLRPPIELERNVRLATVLEDHRILVIHEDGTATIRPGDVGHERAPSPASLPAGPPTPVDLSIVRALYREGVIFEDGTAAMFWSEEQLLRPLVGFSAPVELAGGYRSICVRTEERMVFCRHDLRGPGKRTPDPSPVVLEHAQFDPSRDFYGHPTTGEVAP